MIHRAFRELAAGAALDDLEPAEARRLDDHLAGCVRCRRDRAALVDVAAALALVAPTRRPPAGLKRRMVASITASRAPGPAERLLGDDAASGAGPPRAAATPISTRGPGSARRA